MKDSARAVRAYWEKERLPFVGLPDPGGEITRAYRQPWRLLKLGRMPAVFLIDGAGRIAASHRGRSMKDIPPAGEVLAALEVVREAG